MKYIIAIAFMVLCNGYVTGQTDTIKVDLTALQSERIDEYNKAKEELKRQYDQAVRQVNNQFADHLKFIADANAIDPNTIHSYSIKDGKITFITNKPKKE